MNNKEKMGIKKTVGNKLIRGKAILIALAIMALATGCGVNKYGSTPEKLIKTSSNKYLDISELLEYKRVQDISYKMLVTGFGAVLSEHIPEEEQIQTADDLFNKINDTIDYDYAAKIIKSLNLSSLIDDQQIEDGTEIATREYIQNLITTTLGYGNLDFEDAYNLGIYDLYEIKDKEEYKKCLRDGTGYDITREEDEKLTSFMKEFDYLNIFGEDLKLGDLIIMIHNSSYISSKDGSEILLERVNSQGVESRALEHIALMGYTDILEIEELEQFDTDNDGVTDWEEIIDGTNPRDPGDYKITE